MRTLPVKTLLFAFFLSQLLASCKKEPVTSGNGIPLYENETETQLLQRGCKRKCLVSHTGDDLVFVSPGIFYNKNGDPDSIQFDQSPVAVKALYNKRGKLKTLYYINTYDHAEFIYGNRHDDLPLKINYYTSNYTDYGMADSLCATAAFRYDQNGNVVQYKRANLWYPGYDFTLDLTYNHRGNVKTISRTPQGGTTFTEYSFTSYDNRSNFMSGNPWTKFMLLNTGFEPYYFLLFSENNAAKWSWKYDPSVASLNFTSTFKYNYAGFANNVYLHLEDNDGIVYGDFIRTSCSTCDGNCNAGNSTARNRPNGNTDLQKKIKKQTSGLINGEHRF